MIISRVPRPVHAFKSIFGTLCLLLVWDIGVTVLYFNDYTHFGGIEIQFTLFGSVIALFIGFMVNAGYARWWEARTLWGQVVNSSRSLARQSVVLIDDGSPSPVDLAVNIVHTQVAYVHVLRTALRGQPLPIETQQYLPADYLDALARAQNRQTALLTRISLLLRSATSRNVLQDLPRLQMETTLVALTDAQGGLERIKNTPLPVQYRFLPRLFARLFCLILPFAVVNDLGWVTPIGSSLIGLMFLLAVEIGDELAEPFRDSEFDVPMTALCRTIEIDLMQAIGQTPPERVQPVNSVLW